jgi:hypothetical protein
VLVKPPFSGGRRMRSRVLRKRGSQGEMKKTRGAIRMEESSIVLLSKLCTKHFISSLYPTSS